MSVFIVMLHALSYRVVIRARLQGGADPSARLDARAAPTDHRVALQRRVLLPLLSPSRQGGAGAARHLGEYSEGSFIKRR